MLTLTKGYGMDPHEVLLSAKFREEYSQMVIVKDIDFFSLCEHHMLPFYGKAHVAYIPNGYITGLSKIARVVDIFSHRLQVQERMTLQIKECIQQTLNPLGVMVVVEASTCVCRCAAWRNRTPSPRPPTSPCLQPGQDARRVYEPHTPAVGLSLLSARFRLWQPETGRARIVRRPAVGPRGRTAMCRSAQSVPVLLAVRRGLCAVCSPKSVIRVQSNFVLLPCRLFATFAEGVAGYAETKRQTRCRQQDERAWKTEERQPNPKSVV